MAEKFLLTAIRSVQPFARIVGDLWQVTAEADGRPRIVTDNELYGQCYFLISNGAMAVPIQYSGMNFLLAEPNSDPAQVIATLPDNQYRYELKKKNIHASSINGELGLRRAMTMKVRSVLEDHRVRRIGPSKYSLMDLLARGGLNKEWFSAGEVEGDIGVLGFRRYCTFVSEALDTSHSLLTCKTRSMITLRDDTQGPYALDTLFEKHRAIKDYVESAQNQEDRILVRYKLDTATYSPVAVEYSSPSSLWEPRYNMTLYERLSKEFGHDEELLKEIELAKDDPFIVRAYRLGKRRVGIPEPIIPRLATPIVTLSNYEFLQEKLRKNVSWREATQIHPKLHYYGALGLRNVINSSNAKLFDTPLDFDLPLCVETMNPASRAEVRPLTLFSVPQPVILLRDWAQQVVKRRLSGRIRSDVMRTGENFPYVPISLRERGYAIVCPESEKDKARLLKNVLESSSIVSFLFGKKGGDLAAARNLLRYSWISEAKPEAYVARIREIKDDYSGIFALIPSRDVEISTDIFRAIKVESTYNDVPVQPIQLRKDYSFFDGNLWYAMFRKNKGSAIGIDMSELNVPRDTVLMARDVGGRQNGTELGFSAFTSSVNSDMATGYVLSERATIHGETVENVHEILDRTKQLVWRDRMKVVPGGVIRLRDGYTPPYEHDEELRFFSENGIPLATIDILNDAGGKFLTKVMDRVDRYNVPLAAVILDNKTAILQPHMVRSTFPPSPLKVKLTDKSKGFEQFSIYDAISVVAYSVFITHSTMSVEYVKVPDVVAKAHKAAELHRIAALPSTGTFWIGHFD